MHAHTHVASATNTQVKSKNIEHGPSSYTCIYHKRLIEKQVIQGASPTLIVLSLRYQSSQKKQKKCRIVSQNITDGQAITKIINNCITYALEQSDITKSCV